MTTVTRSSSANLGASQKLAVKKGDAMMSSKGISNRSNRSALGDIGNKVSNMTIDPTKKALGLPVIKKEIIQKSKFTRSKTTVSESDILLQEKESACCSRAYTIFKDAIEPIVSTVDLMDISEDKPDAFSKVLLTVEDIDANDKDNPQLVSDYVNDIYHYMRHLEETFAVKANFLEGQEVTGKMRSILIDWLCQVHHRFHLLQETLYLTVSIIDRFLQVHPISRNKLQLVGVTSMLLASKYEEMYAPEVADFVYITDNAYTKADIRTMEQTILKTLDFSFGKPLCLHFLRRNSKAGQVDATKHTLAKYLMELTIIEYDMVHCNPSIIAAAALCLSMKVLDDSQWSETLAHYSNYSEKEIYPVMQKLAQLVVKAETSKLTAVKIKYSSSRFMKISSIPELKSNAITDLVL
uniref:G2/mitotic-specific cyclin-B n=1 Tax=Patella vulgata TaxID=6465 RepID=CCNB_PATVU|nr:RecName: Full=G2/mitotic-specific cyclin-B [Patella vulgata]CAA41255.1 cyclin B [Patella vulgata]